METLSRVNDFGDTDRSRKCLICYASISENSTSKSLKSGWNASQSHSKVESQLEVIFLLRKVLQLPSSHLQELLRNHGDPEEWDLWLCGKCSENVGKIRKIFIELQTIQRRFEKVAWAVREEVRKTSAPAHLAESSQGEGDGAKALEIVDKCRREVLECGPDFLPSANPFLPGDIQAAELLLKDEYLYLAEVEVSVKTEADFLPSPEVPDISQFEEPGGRCDYLGFSSSSEPAQFQTHDPNPQVHKTTLYKCPEVTCNKLFESEVLVHLHLRMDHGSRNRETLQSVNAAGVNKRNHLAGYGSRFSKKTKCPWPGCPQLLQGPLAIKAHLANDHGKRPSFRCDDCGADFIHEGTLRRHISAFHSLDLTPCTTITTESSSSGPSKPKSQTPRRRKKSATAATPGQKRSKRGRRRQPPGQLSCPTCGKVYPYKVLLSAHIKSAHAPRLPCPVCGKILSENNLKDHHKRMHTDSAIKCRICAKIFPTLDRRKKHMSLRHPGQPEVEDPLQVHVCEICGKKFNSSANYRRHKAFAKGHSEKERVTPVRRPKPKGNPTATPTPTVRSGSDSEEMATCEICGKLMRKISLYAHIRRGHERRFAVNCEICGIYITSKFLLPQHMANAHGIGDFKCNVEGCTKTFHKEKLLKEHKLYKHEGHKRPRRRGKGVACICGICGKQFPSSTHRKRHEEALHGEDRQTKPHICSICGKAFGHQYYLEYHVRGVHKVDMKGQPVKERVKKV